MAALRRLNTLLGKKLGPRADDPYCTHIPVLVGVARLAPIRKVLEFGGGRHSTLTFLDRASFPELVALTTLENDPDWCAVLSGYSRDDPRMELVRVEGPMCGAAERMDLARYDLV